MPRTKLQTPNFRLNRRPDGYYDIRYTDPATGKGKSKSTGTKDANEAEAERARFAFAHRQPSLKTRPTIAEVCDGFLAARTPFIASPQSLPYLFTPVKRHLGSIYADDITQTAVNGYIKVRKTERPQRDKRSRYKDNPVSTATINKELRMLRAALNWAASERKIERQPNFRIELTSGGVRDRWITKEDANKIIASSSHHVALFLLIALGSAKRREAILSLTWDRVHLSHQGFEKIDFGEDVGNKRRGSTQISGNKRLIEALKAAEKIAKTEYVIEFRKKRLFDIKVGLKAACVKAGIDPVSSHTLKHSAITWMVHAGLSYEEIAKFSATSKEIIEKVYGHHSPSFVAAASAALAF